MEFTFLDPYLNPSAERKTIKRYATVRSGVGIDMIRKRSTSTDLLPVLPVRGVLGFHQNCEGLFIIQTYKSPYERFESAI